MWDHLKLFQRCFIFRGVFDHHVWFLLGDFLYYISHYTPHYIHSIDYRWFKMCLYNMNGWWIMRWRAQLWVCPKMGYPAGTLKNPIWTCPHWYLAILGYPGILHFWLYFVAVVILCGCRITTSMRQQHGQTFLSEQATNTRPVECKVVLVYH